MCSGTLIRDRRHLPEFSVIKHIDFTPSPCSATMNDSLVPPLRRNPMLRQEERHLRYDPLASRFREPGDDPPMHASSAISVLKRETAHRMFWWAVQAPSARLERATLCSASKCSIQLSYEGIHATRAAPPAGREGFEPSVEALQPRQALSRRPRSATPAPPLTGTTWPRWVLSRPSSVFRDVRRRERDSNPRWVAPQLFSRQPP